MQTPYIPYLQLQQGMNRFSPPAMPEPRAKFTAPYAPELLFSSEPAEPVEQDDRPLMGPEGSAIRELLMGLAAFQRELLYQAHAIHLNLTGPNFLPLHELFKSEYEQLLEQFDTTAEYLRILDVTFPLTAQALRLKLSSDFRDLEDTATIPMLITYHENLKQLVVAASCVEHCAAEERMIDIANTMAEFVNAANKTAWFLRSMLCACAD